VSENGAKTITRRGLLKKALYAPLALLGIKPKETPPGSWADTHLINWRDGTYSWHITLYSRRQKEQPRFEEVDEMARRYFGPIKINHTESGNWI
jgi:hypothetical protein